jgi:hypothetical protein
MKKPYKPPKARDDIKTFRKIRNMIGILGMGLPILLFIMSNINFFETPPQPSISHYYYTNCREIFTGVLCAVGVFLILYQGHTNEVFWKNDKLMTNIAGALAIGVAFLPTNPFVCTDKTDSLLHICAPWTGLIHYILAAFFILILANISFNIFVLGQKTSFDIPVYVFNENHIYKTCGIVIFISVVSIPVFIKLKHFPRSTYWLETVALLAFGFSWLVKGRAFGQKGIMGRILYREDNKYISEDRNMPVNKFLMLVSRKMRPYAEALESKRKASGSRQ